MGGSKLSEKLIKDYLKTKKLIKLFQYDISKNNGHGTNKKMHIRAYNEIILYIFPIDRENDYSYEFIPNQPQAKFRTSFYFYKLYSLEFC